MQNTWNCLSGRALRASLFLAWTSALAAQPVPFPSPPCLPEPAAAVDAFLAREPGFALRATATRCSPGGPILDYLTGGPVHLRSDGRAAGSELRPVGFARPVPVFGLATGVHASLARARRVAGGRARIGDPVAPAAGVESVDPLVVTTIVAVPLTVGRPPVGDAYLLMSTLSQWEPQSRTLADRPGLLAQIQRPVDGLDLGGPSDAEARFDAAFGSDALRRGVSFNRARFDLLSGRPMAYFGTAVGHESGYAAGVFRVGKRWLAVYTWASGPFNDYLLGWAAEPAPAWSSDRP